MSDVATSPALSATEPSGIAGWLLLPALVIVFSPLRIAYDFYQSFFPILKPSLWFALLSSKSGMYNPPLALLLAWEIIANIIFFALTLWLAFLFFKKQKQVPTLYAGWLILTCVLQMADLFFGSLVPGVAQQQDGSAYTELAKSAIASAIWIPYFLTSRRVKNTFVNDAEIKLPISSWP